MTVAELIEKLKEFHPEAQLTVRTWEDYFDLEIGHFEAFEGELCLIART